MNAPGSWSVEPDPSEADVAVITDGVIEFGRAEAAGGDARPIGCFLRDGERVLAGATGRTEFGRLFVSYVWVDEPLRGRGLGTEALRRIEAAGRERGARDVLIETLSDRTAALYEREGYTSISRIEGYVGRFTKHVLRKDL